MRKQNVKFVQKRNGDVKAPGSAAQVHYIVNSKLHQLLANPMLRGMAQG